MTQIKKERDGQTPKKYVIETDREREGILGVDTMKERLDRMEEDE